MPTPILRFSQEKPALLLLAYLQQQGIEAEVQSGFENGLDITQTLEQAPHTKDDSVNESPTRSAAPPPRKTQELQMFELLIIHKHDVDRAIVIAKQFLASPGAEKYQQAAWEQNHIASQSQSIFIGFNLESVRNWRSYLFTHFVGITCIIVFALMSLGFQAPIFDALKIQYFSELSESHQWYRIFGPNFMHGSTIHLVMNLFWWWLLASHIERLFGTSSLITLFVVSTLAANITQLMYSGPNFLGLSGINYAIFGFMWWIDWLRPKWGIAMPKGLIIIMLLWILVGYANVFAVPFANEAHTFGLISGCLMAFLLHHFSDYFDKNSQ